MIKPAEGIQQNYGTWNQYIKFSPVSIHCQGIIQNENEENSLFLAVAKKYITFIYLFILTFDFYFEFVI